ncbi:MAG: tetratricopeptide repeat protein [Gammaproteobacteria bacterium]
MTVFAILGALFTVLAVGLVVWPLLRGGVNPHPLAATLTALAIPAAVLITYLIVSDYDWRNPVRSGDSAAASSSTGPGSIEDATASLERRLQSEPENEEGWLLLGSSYLNLERPADAIKAYQRALDLSGGRNVDARLGLAEARIVIDPGSLTGQVGDEVEAVLRVEPRNPKGLWYGGLLGLARGQPALARERWTTLLELSPPERVRQIIESQLAELPGGPGAVASVPATAPAVPDQKAASTGVHIRVTVSVAGDLKGRVAASAPLFIFLRDGANPGPPLAVVRRQAVELPLTVEISDADLMLPGRSLAGLETATLVARVANGGDPVAKPGDIFGEVRWERGTGGSSPVAVLIDKVVGR